MTRQNCTCAVYLLCHDEASELMRERHRPEREEVAAAPGLGSSFLRPPVRRTDGEDNKLRSFVAATPYPTCKVLGTHLPAAPVEQHNRWLGAALLAADPIKERSFAAECMALASRNPNTTL